MGQPADPLKCKGGFRRDEGSLKNVRFVIEAQLTKEVGDQAYLKTVILPALRKSGHLMAGGTGNTCSVSQRGLGRIRYIRLKKSGSIEAVTGAIDRSEKLD